MLHEIITKGKLANYDVQITNPIYNMIIEEVATMNCPRINVLSTDDGRSIIVDYQRVSIMFTPNEIIVTYLGQYSISYDDFNSVKKILRDLLL